MFVKRALLLVLWVSITLPVQAEDNVLVSIRPLALIYQALMPDANVQVLLPADKNLHDYALGVSDMRVLQAATVFFWLGDHNEHFIQRLQQRFAAQSQWYALAPGSDHIWLNPAKQPQLINAMADVLVQRYPQQAEAIRQRQAALVQSLQQWQQQWQERLAAHKNTNFVLGHDAFLPFAKGLGLQGALMYRASHSHGHAHAGAQSLTAIQRYIAAGDVQCAIEEPDVSFAQLAGRYPQLKRYVLEPAAGSIALQPDGFVRFMQHSAEILYQCLGAE